MKLQKISAVIEQFNTYIFKLKRNQPRIKRYLTTYPQTLFKKLLFLKF